ncbi:MAG: hypothetical protein R3247_11455 [Rhodothermales bacterium]|nr:hypothetical protein [Rhodothermales bacterium]
MRLSILTHLPHPTASLAPLARGLASGGVLPDEWVVAVPPGAALPAAPFPVRDVEVPEGSRPGVALNAAARAARGDVYIVLSAGCVPSCTLVSCYRLALEVRDGVALGELLHLPPGLLGGPWCEAELWHTGRRDPERPAPPRFGLLPTDRYDLFASRSFAVRRHRFFGLGGFDEAAADAAMLDAAFARAARRRGCPLLLVSGAEVFYEPSYPHRAAEAA